MRTHIIIISSLTVIWNYGNASTYADSNSGCSIDTTSGIYTDRPTSTSLFIHRTECENGDLEGLWVNEDMENAGITRCNIRYEDNRFYVRVWGKCDPTDCDWGETASNPISQETNMLILSWNPGFVERVQTLEIVDGKLIMTTESHYKNNRPDNVHVETFIKK